MDHRTPNIGTVNEYLFATALARFYADRTNVSRRGNHFCLFRRQEVQELFAPSLVVVRLRAEQSSENCDILLVNELFQ